MIPGLLAFVLWAAVMPLLFKTQRAQVAAFVTMLGATMWLPELYSIELRVLPDLGKEELGSLLAGIGCYVWARPYLRRARFMRGPELLLALMAFANIGSLLTNQDPIYSGNIVVPANSVLATWIRILADFLTWGIPFFVGRALFVNGRDLRSLMTVLVVAGLLYTPLIFIELWLSPQMHKWTYGYHQHAFSQTLRGDGYRPMVYMRHGLHLTLFIYLTFSAAAALAAARVRPLRVPALPLTGFLGAVLVLCKSTGSTVYGFVTVPLVLFTSVKLQVRVALLIACVAAAYPIARMNGWIPVDSIVELAEEQFGTARAHSLAGRLRTETEMAERVLERFWFGWSSAGRAALRDPITGEFRTTYDGLWLLHWVRGGVFNLVAIFGLLLYPVFVAARALPRIRARADRALVGALALMVAINVFDDLPNSTMECYLTMLSGALLGGTRGILKQQMVEQRRRRMQQGQVRGGEPNAGGTGDVGAA